MNLDWLGLVATVDASCVVPDDDSCVVRGARPLTPADAEKLREQAISRLQRDPAAILARETRIQIEHSAGRVVRFRKGR